MAYIELSYEIEKTWCNVDVQNLINKLRKADNITTGPTAIYSGFELLATHCLTTHNKTCSNLDNI